MRKKKLVLVFGSVAVLVVALFAAGTLAYLTAQESATNVLTTGSIDIQLNDSIPGGSQTETGWSIENVMPGTEVEKIVSVTNTDTEPVWVRVILNISAKDADGKSLPSENILNITAGDGWTKGEDGAYYYNTALDAAQTTSSLFAQNVVEIDPLLDNAYQNAVITIDVTAQAVQVKNNPIPAGGDVTDVQGWPDQKANPADSNSPIEEVEPIAEEETATEEN